MKYVMNTVKYGLLFYVLSFVSMAVNAQTTINLLEKFTGNYDYKIIGATENYNEFNCTDIGDQTKYLSLPSGSKVTRAYLYWSGSGSLDSRVYLNGTSVYSEENFSFYAWNGYDMRFYGARADVTHLVNGNKDYKVSGLSWSKPYSLCNGYGAYGGWTLVVVYENSSAPENEVTIHDGFRGYWPEGTVTNYLKNITVPTQCAKDVELTAVTWEGDNYKGEYFHINNYYIGGNTLNGSTDPNLDIDKYNLNSYVSPGDTQIKVHTRSYRYNNAIELYLNNVYVVKSKQCPAYASIGDRVWFDDNRNGLQDPGEVGVSNVGVSLTDTQVMWQLRLQLTPVVITCSITLNQVIIKSALI